MRLSCLFEQCLTADYTRVGESVDYALKRQGDTLYLYLEDSDGCADWRANLDFPAVAYRRDGKTVFRAHRGFLKAWRTLEGAIAEAVLDPSLRAFTAVGYSHGAALAVLAHEYAWYHRKDLRPRLRGFGFGCPRVIFMPSPSLYERWKSFTAVRNLGDIVTHLPPAILGYRHVGHLLEIGARGRYSPIDAHRPENILRELWAIEK